MHHTALSRNTFISSNLIDESPSTLDCPQYAFGINIFASASVLNLVQPDAKPFQIAVPLLMTFSQSNPAFHFSMVTDPALLKAFKYSGSGAAANYFFPPVYFNGLPSKLGVRVLFQVVRAPLLITWAMFVVCMVSGLLGYASIHWVNNEGSGI